MSDGQQQKRKVMWQAGGGVPTPVEEKDGKMPSLKGFLKGKGVDMDKNPVRVYKDGNPIKEGEYDEPMDNGTYALATAPKAGI